MKKVFRKVAMGIFCISVLTWSSCSKQYDPAGTGLAKISSTSSTAYSFSWTSTGFNTFYEVVNVPGLSDVNKDAVMVYVSQDQQSYFALPISNYLETGDNLGFGFANGQVGISYSSSTNTSLKAPTIILYFKIVVIPPALKKLNNGVNYNNYQEVKTKFQQYWSSDK